MSEVTEPRDENLPAGTPAPESSVATDAAPHANVSAAEAHEPATDSDHESEGSDDEADDSDGDAEGAGGAEVTADGQPAKKKKRRRRKKKPGVTADGQPLPEGQQKAEGQKKAPRKEVSQLPFGKYFEGAARKHAFSVGEVVAGRVTRVESGAILVDLFGKATAIVDEHEPREVEAIVEAPAAVAAPVEGAEATEATATEASTESSAGGVAALAEAAIAAEAESTAHAEAHGHDHDDDAHEAPAEAHHVVELPPPAIGEIFRGRIGAVAESGHVAIINRAIDIAKARAAITDARDKRKRVHGLVYGFNRGGFDVLVFGLRAFCPASGMSLSHIENPEELIGRKLEFSLPETKAGSHGIIVSRRSILERDNRKKARDRAKALKVGERVKGRVSQVREFGFFLDIGDGLEGMVHVSEMSWDRSLRPSDFVKVGDEIEAQIVKIPEGRKERHERIGLSTKSVAADPWDAHGELLAEGRIFKGKVARVAEFGAFIEIAPAIEGLLHVSELGHNIEHANKVVKPGDELDLVIDRVDKKARRVSLSKLSSADMQAIADGKVSENALRAPKPGGTVQFIVERIEHHGIFGQIAGVLGKRGRAYLSNGDSNTEKGADMRKHFPTGKTFDVKVVGADRDGSIRVSRKALIVDEEKRAVQDYRREASKQGFGTFGDLLRAKLGEDKT